MLAYELFNVKDRFAKCPVSIFAIPFYLPFSFLCNPRLGSISLLFPSVVGWPLNPGGPSAFLYLAPGFALPILLSMPAVVAVVLFP